MLAENLLYYPYVEPPTEGGWIRQALLFSDTISSMMPDGYRGKATGQASGTEYWNSGLRYLEDEGLFTPIRLSDNVAAWIPLLDELKRELERLVAETFPVSPSDDWASDPSRNVFIYPEKIGAALVGPFVNKGLVQEAQDGLYRFESKAAELYMATLAKFAALGLSKPTVAATDNKALSRTIFEYDPKVQAPDDECSLSCRLERFLPVPAETTPLNKIVAFRAKHRAELLALRSAIAKFQTELTKAGQDAAHSESLVRDFVRNIERERLTLARALKGHRIDTRFGSVTAFLKQTSLSSIVGGSVVFLGKAATLATVPIPIVVGTAAIVGCIEVRLHRNRKIQERNAAIERSPFAYLLLAEEQLTKSGSLRRS